MKIETMHAKLLALYSEARSLKLTAKLSNNDQLTSMQTILLWDDITSYLSNASDEIGKAAMAIEKAKPSALTGKQL